MLEKLIKNSFVRNVCFAGSLLGSTLWGCSKEGNPVSPRYNEPPKMEFTEIELFDHPKGLDLHGADIHWRATDDEDVVRIDKRTDNAEWKILSNSRSKIIHSAETFNFVDHKSHTIQMKAIDSDGAEDIETYNYVYQSSTPTPTLTPPPTTEQKYTSPSSGNITINSTQGDSYNFTLLDKENKQPISNLVLYYEEGIGGKIIMIEDSQKRYYSTLETIVDNSPSLAGSSNFVLEFEKKLTGEFIEGVKNVKFIDVEVNMPEPKSGNLQLIASGVRAGQLPEIYKNNDFLIENKSVLNFVFEKTGYDWAATLGDFRQEFIDNTDNMVYIMRDLRQKVDPNTPMYDYVFDIYVHKTMGVLVHKARKVPLGLIKTSFLMAPIWGEDTKIAFLSDSDSPAPSDFRDTNYGADSLLQVGHVRTTITYDSYFLLRFDLFNYFPGRRIAKAELSLYISDFNGWVDYDRDRFKLYAHNITSEWDEHTVTWNNSPTYNENLYSPSDIYNISDFSNGGEVKIDISDLAKEWGGYGNNGILIDVKGSSDNAHGINNVLCRFYSREHQDSKFWSRLDLYSY